MNFYPIYKNKKLLPWIKWWLIKGNKVAPKHLSEWIDSAEAITLTGVYKGSKLLNLNLKGNTSQTEVPSPEAPVPVNVVKGNNTIKINDTDYQVSLNDLELCKIGDYQDVIYKENNKWYVDKYIGKIVLNGSEPTISSDSTGLLWGFTDILSDKLGLSYTTSQVLQGYCDYYLPSSLTSSRSNGKRICVYPNQTIWVTKDDLTVKADFISFLNSHNVTLYYVLAESTQTEITETNLISQLEAIYNAKLQSGTNEITQTPADLPFYLNFQYYEKG